MNNFFNHIYCGPCLFNGKLHLMLPVSHICRRIGFFKAVLCHWSTHVVLCNISHNRNFVQCLRWKLSRSTESLMWAHIQLLTSLSNLLYQLLITANDFEIRVFVMSQISPLTIVLTKFQSLDDMLLDIMNVSELLNQLLQAGITFQVS